MLSQKQQEAWSTCLFHLHSKDTETASVCQKWPAQLNGEGGMIMMIIVLNIRGLNMVSDLRLVVCECECWLLNPYLLYSCSNLVGRHVLACIQRHYSVHKPFQAANWPILSIHSESYCQNTLGKEWWDMIWGIKIGIRIRIKNRDRKCYIQNLHFIIM